MTPRCSWPKGYHRVARRRPCRAGSHGACWMVSTTSCSDTTRSTICHRACRLNTTGFTARALCSLAEGGPSPQAGGGLAAGRGVQERVEHPGEARLVSRAVDARRHLALLADHHGIGRAREAEAVGDAEVGIEARRVARAVGLEEDAGVRLRVLDVDGHELDAARPVLLVGALDPRRLGGAELAP